MSVFQLNTGIVLTCSRWILKLEKIDVLEAKYFFIFIFVHMHTQKITHTQSCASLPAGAITLKQIIQCHREPCLWASGPLQTGEAAGQGPTAAWNSLPLGSSKKESPSLSPLENDQLSFHPQCGVWMYCHVPLTRDVLGMMNQAEQTNQRFLWDSAELCDAMSRLVSFQLDLLQNFKPSCLCSLRGIEEGWLYTHTHTIQWWASPY